MSFRKDGRVDLRKLPKIVYRPLLKHGAAGMASQLLHTEHDEGAPTPDVPLLEVDSRLNGRPKLETEIHEAMHLACPWAPEIVVSQTSRYIAMVIWHLGYRQEKTPE
jgi:hypothetical protein